MHQAPQLCGAIPLRVYLVVTIEFIWATSSCVCAVLTRTDGSRLCEPN